MLHVYKAITQLGKEIRSLEEAKVLVDELIIEKQKQIEKFTRLVEAVHEEGRNEKGKSTKTTRGE